MICATICGEGVRGAVQGDIHPVALGTVGRLTAGAVLGQDHEPDRRDLERQPAGQAADGEHLAADLVDVSAAPLDDLAHRRQGHGDGLDVFAGHRRFLGFVTRQGRWH
jgi:hypothetical protein